MTRLLSIVAIILSIVAIGVVLSKRQPPALKAVAAEAAQERDEARADAQPPGSDAAQRLRISSLEMTVGSLVRRVSALEKTPAAVRGGSVALKDDDRQQVERLRKEVDSLLTGEAIASDAGRKRFKEVLRTVQDEVFAERMQDAMVQIEKDRADRLKKLADEAQLSDAQQQNLQRLLDEESQKRQALLEQVRAGNNPPGAERGAMRQVRQQTDQAVQQVLDQGQYDKYQQMRQAERNAFRGGPGGGPPPPSP